MSRPLRAAAAAAASLLLTAAVGPASAQGARVSVLTRENRVAVVSDPWLPTSDPLLASGAAARTVRARPASGRTVRGELVRLYREHLITRTTYHADLGALAAAVDEASRLGGLRGAELGSVITNLHGIAAAGELTSSRLAPLFLTLQRNAQWWAHGRLLSSGDRVQFEHSPLVWEYYPGQGIELQQLGSWGQVDWRFTAGRRFWPGMLRVVDALIPMAANRGGGLAWEYYFGFAGGEPPWTSAMSQATALQALTEAYEVTGDQRYLRLARRTLGVLGERPPVGVSVPTPRGLRFLLYSFDPGQAVINGFLQTLIGLFDYAKVSGSARGHRLFAAGDAEARHELPSYDTGAWSLYQPGEESSLDYHQLVTDFLQQLCSRTHAGTYCRTARRFRADLKTPPALQLLTRSVPTGRWVEIWFRVSKASRVGITLAHNRRTTFLTSGDFVYGVHHFVVPPLSRAGGYGLTLDATDLAGNYARVPFALQAT